MRVIAILLVSLSLFSAQAADKAQCDDKASLEKAVSDLRHSPETNPAECPNAKPLPSILNGFDPRRPPTAGRDMKSIEMPIDGKVAKLFYANYPASSNSKGTVIVLGGGPAMTSLSLTILASAQMPKASFLRARRAPHTP